MTDAATSETVTSDAPTGGATAERPASMPWRDNLEAMTVAIVMAVMLKYFIVEAYKIPTGSMQPTLFGQAWDENRDGMPDGGVFDRILVDKLSYHFRDPERFDIVVFKYPLDRSKNFVKRLVGMPGETLRIHRGDLWTRHAGERDWTLLRRPRKVMDEVWKDLDLAEDEGLPLWEAGEGAQGWTVDGDRLVAGSAGTAWFIGHGNGTGSVVDLYQHGYPAAIRKRIGGAREHLRVGDLRVTGEVRPRADCQRVVIELEEQPLVHRFVLPGPAAPADARCRIETGAASGSAGSATQASERGPLTADRAVAFEVENLDDRLELWLDGELLCQLDTTSVDLNSGGDAHTGIRITLEGGGAELDELACYRDIHYKPAFDGTSEWDIPEGHYFMLGDNTQDSSDGREWAWYTLSWDGEGSEGRPVRGNRRLALGGNQPADANPVDAPSDSGMLTFFRDEWGERYVFPAVSKRAVLGATGERAPFVPRELITGRALLVFWPVKPWQGIVRFERVH